MVIMIDIFKQLTTVFTSTHTDLLPTHYFSSKKSFVSFAPVITKAVKGLQWENVAMLLAQMTYGLLSVGRQLPIRSWTPPNSHFTTSSLQPKAWSTISLHSVVTPVANRIWWAISHLVDKPALCLHSHLHHSLGHLKGPLSSRLTDW